MLSCVRITQPRWHQRRVCSICRRFSVKPNHSPSKPKAWDHLDKECVDFLPWLERKAGVGISSKLYIGQSTHGRSLFASKRILEGECILTVPYNVQITSDNLLRKVEIMLGDKVRQDIKLAIVLLVEQKIGPKSGWAPYISRLPRSGEMHSPVYILSFLLMLKWHGGNANNSRELLMCEDPGLKSRKCNQKKWRIYVL